MKVSIYALFFYTLKINRLGAIFFLRSKLTLAPASGGKRISESKEMSPAGGGFRGWTKYPLFTFKPMLARGRMKSPEAGIGIPGCARYPCVHI